MTTFAPYHERSDTALLKFLGDVTSVINGEVSEENLFPNASKHFQYALGAGTFRDKRAIGETLLINRTAIVSHVEQEELVTDQGKEEVRTPFLMGLGPEEYPSALFHLRFPRSTSLSQLYQGLLENFPAFAIAGYASFDHISTTYLKRPPIHHESINEHADRYWAATEKYAKMDAIFFGVVLQQERASHFAKAILSRGFYENPKEMAQANTLFNHTHAALLAEKCDLDRIKEERYFYNQFRLNAVSSVRHCLTDSRLNEALFALFALRDVLVVPEERPFEVTA